MEVDMFTEQLLYNFVLSDTGNDAIDLDVGEEEQTTSIVKGVGYRLKATVDCRVWFIPSGGEVTGTGTLLSEGESYQFVADSNKTLRVVRESSDGLLNISRVTL